jgi:hypothetical protein
MDFWDDVSRAQIRNCIGWEQAAAWRAATGGAATCLCRVPSVKLQIKYTERDFLSGIVVRLVMTDSLASAAGRDTAGPIGSGLDRSSPRGDG